MPRRKVYFFRIDVGLDDRGHRAVFDPGPALVHLDGLDAEARTVPQGDGQATSCWVDAPAAPYRVRLGRIRRTDLPQLEQNGDVQPLIIPEEAGLLEQTHVVFFANNVLGVLFNFYGPRASTLSSYLRHVYPDLPDRFSINQLLRQDVVEQLDRFGRIRVLDLSMNRTFADAVAQADEGLAAAFQAQAEFAGAETLELTLKPERYSRGWLRRRVLDFAKRLVRMEGLREEVHRFRVKGQVVETGRLQDLDLLRDQLVVARDVEARDDRHRALRDESAYNAITDAYGELREHLEAAAALE